MASPYYVRTFLSGELIVGVRRSDPFNVQNIKQKVHHKKATFVPKRYLSEEPCTYL